MAPTPAVTSMLFDKVPITIPLHLNTLQYSAHYTVHSRSPSVKQILGSSKLGVTTVQGWVRTVLRGLLEYLYLSSLDLDTILVQGVPVFHEITIFCEASLMAL